MITLPSSNGARLGANENRLFPAAQIVLLEAQCQAFMAVILQPSRGEDLMLNWWTWRPILAVLVRAGIVPAGEREERCSANGCGGYLSEGEALRAADYVASLVGRMQPGERLLHDGTVTNKPKEPLVTASELDDNPQRSYSADYEVLKQFAEFCRRSCGFRVV